MSRESSVNSSMVEDEDSASDMDADLDEENARKHGRSDDGEDTGDDNADDNADDNGDADTSVDGASTRRGKKKYQKYPDLDPLKAPPGKKVPLHLLEKRRLGRLKAAEEFARKLKVVGIERVENLNLPQSGLFSPVPLINQKNYSSDYLRKDENAFAVRERKQMRNSNANNSAHAKTSELGSGAQSASMASSASLDALVDTDTKLQSVEDIDFNDPRLTIVIHPGSDSIKIGLATDEEPVSIPNLVAVPRSQVVNPVDETPVNVLNIELDDQFHELTNQLKYNFKERMKYYKRKMQSNAHEQVTSFNSNSKPEEVSDKNDQGKIDWIYNADKKYYGEDAQRCIGDEFILRRPFCKSGIFNLESNNYSSIQDLLGDVSELVDSALSSDKFNITKSEYKHYKAVIVIPDLFKKSHLETFIRLLLNEMDFRSVALMQESLATCYGAGISTPTCVVNIGAEQIRIACVDDGTIIQDSAVTLDYGGNDVTNLLAILLQQSKFPYKNWNLSTLYGWKTAEDFKKKFVTFQDADIAVQLFNFIKRVPGIPSEKYDFKVFDEVILAPLGLFYPEIFKYVQERQRPTAKEYETTLLKQIEPSRDIYTNSLNDWRSITQRDCEENMIYCDAKDDLEIIQHALDLNIHIEDLQSKHIEEKTDKKCFVPLDKAIVQSITNAAINVDISKISQFYSNIIIVGGGANIPALDFILSDRINIWRPAVLGISSFPNFYKSLTKQLKDIQTSNKSNTGDKSQEQEVAERSIALVKVELDKLVASLEIPNSGDHFFTVGVLPAPRNLDPSLLDWKGASVLAQIKLIEELYISRNDWDVHGNRVLQYLSLIHI